MRRRPERLRWPSVLCLAALLLSGWPKAVAGTHWMSRAQRGPQHMTRAGAWAADVLYDTPTFFDVVVSLHRRPAGAERTPYEEILRYFADGVYEQSNGSHKIRTVRVYTGGLYSDRADVLWTERGHPAADINGWGSDGTRQIYMFDVFSDGCGKGCPYDLLADPEGAGYTLAHEWGHYTYGLYDEYANSENWRHLFNEQPWDTDEAVDGAIMNSQWNARGAEFRWLNHSTPRNDSGQTAQHRMYHASCWTTLGRPTTDDPRTGFMWTRPSRTHWPELAGVTPGEGLDPRIDLPGTARSDLKIVWMTDTLAYEIVIDRSGSMSGTKMANVKAAAKVLVDLAEVGKSRIGVISFSDFVSEEYPLTLVTDEATKSAIKAKIDAIAAGGITAMGEGAQLALDKLKAASTSDESRVAYLLSDGLSNTGRTPMSVVPGYQAAKVALFTFAYGSDADQNLLRDMAVATGGKTYFSLTTPSAITAVFQEANQQVSQTAALITGSTVLAAGASESVAVRVDSTIARLDVVVTATGTNADTNVVLQGPSGTTTAPRSVEAVSGSTQYRFTVASPQPGAWTLVNRALTRSSTFDYRADGTVADSVTGYSLSLASLNGDPVTYPRPLLVRADLSRGLPIAGAIVRASVKRPDGSTSAVDLRDDGVSPDTMAADGRYSGAYLYTQNGLYQVTVVMDNSAGLARRTYAGLLIEGELPPDEPVAENFSRSATLQVTLKGILSDDHGSTRSAATALASTNVDVPGRIDFDGDVDVFRIVVPSGSSSVTTRLSGLGLGMQPFLQLVNSTGSTVLAQGTLQDSATPDGYLALKVPATAGSTVYAVVSHVATTGRGTYLVSAGPGLAMEQSCYSLTTGPNRPGAGTISVDPPFDCGAGQFKAGTLVTLTASPSGGLSFTSWSGGVSGEDNPRTLTMDTDKTAIANFETTTFSGDGRTDLLWHHQVSGELYSWFLDGTVTFGGSYLDPRAFSDTKWQIRGLGDFNGDGRSDVLWHHQGTGDLYVWYLDRTVTIGGSYLTPRSFSDTKWQIRGVADFNRDGHVDLLWHHQVTGELYVWFMNRLSVASGSFLTPRSFSDTKWQIRGIADVSGDGNVDVLWHHQTTGDLYVWYLNGTVTTGGSYLTPKSFADTNWKIALVADFNGDRKPDLLWHNQANGDLYVWFLDRTVTFEGRYLTPSRFADVNWKIVPR